MLGEPSAHQAPPPSSSQELAREREAQVEALRARQEARQVVQKIRSESVGQPGHVGGGISHIPTLCGTVCSMLCVC